MFGFPQSQPVVKGNTIPTTRTSPSGMPNPFGVLPTTTGMPPAFGQSTFSSNSFGSFGTIGSGMAPFGPTTNASSNAPFFTPLTSTPKSTMPLFGTGASPTTASGSGNNNGANKTSTIAVQPFGSALTTTTSSLSTFGISSPGNVSSVFGAVTSSAPTFVGFGLSAVQPTATFTSTGTFGSAGSNTLAQDSSLFGTSSTSLQGFFGGTSGAPTIGFGSSFGAPSGQTTRFGAPANTSTGGSLFGTHPTSQLFLPPFQCRQPGLNSLQFFGANERAHVSYTISLLIAKSGESRAIGEQIIVPAVNEILRNFGWVHNSAWFNLNNQLQSDEQFLSARNVQQKIIKMSKDVEETLCNLLRTSKFALQLDLSTLQGNVVVLLAYVRFLKEGNLTQELLFARSVSMQGDSTCLILQNYLKDKKIPLMNMIVAAIDGDALTQDDYHAFSAELKKMVPNTMTVHSVIHWQHLVAKHLGNRLHNSLQLVISAVNKMNSFQNGLFEQLCDPKDEQFNVLLFHCDIRWLSSGNCLPRFYSLFEKVLEYFEKDDPILWDNLRSIKCDIAFMADLFSTFRDVNSKLQDVQLNLIELKSIISEFITNILNFKLAVERGVFFQIPNLYGLSLSESKKISDDVQIYTDYLDLLHKDLSARFCDILDMKIPEWIMNPFTCKESSDLYLIQDELNELQNDVDLKFQFTNGYQQFWLKIQDLNRFPVLWTVAAKFLIAFPSSSLVERGFVAILNQSRKQGNRASAVDMADLRLLLTNIQPNILKLVSSDNSRLN